MRLKSGLALAALAIFLATEGDIQLSLALRQHGSFPLAMSLLVGHFLVWLQVLKRLPLSLAVPLTASSYLLIGLLAPSQLAEPLTPKALAGYGLVSLGVLLVLSSEQPNPSPAKAWEDC